MEDISATIEVRKPRGSQGFVAAEAFLAPDLPSGHENDADEAGSTSEDGERYGEFRCACSVGAYEGAGIALRTLAAALVRPGSAIGIAVVS